MRRLLVGILLLAAISQGVDLSVIGTRDALYRQDIDTMVQPVTVLGGVAFNLGKRAGIELRGGYSWYDNSDIRYSSYKENRTRLEAVRFQAIPFLHINTPLSWLALRGGVGLGCSMEETRKDKWYFVPTDGEGTESWQWGGSQTFVLGASFGLNRRIALNLQAERLGFYSYWGLRRDYLINGYGDYETDRHDTFSLGWAARAATAVGVGLRIIL